MKPTERLYKIEDLLNQYGCLSFQALLQRLEVSRATLKRDLAELRDRYHMPIVFDREAGGYRIDRQTRPVGPVQYELPGLWFSAQEIHALLTMHRLIANLDSGGLLGPHVQPLLGRMDHLLGAAHNPADEVVKRVRLLTVGAREFHLEAFQRVGSGLLRRRRLVIDYHARGVDRHGRREVSPQRLIHYRHNWYLDAWCHQREALRSFSVDAIEWVEVLETEAVDVDEDRLDRALGAGYGIFSGEAVKWATLRFSAKLSRWVACEHWHSQQVGRLLDDGAYELSLPYGEATELVMDVLRYGPDCEVLAPEDLRQRVAAALEEASQRYRVSAGRVG